MTVSEHCCLSCLRPLDRAGILAKTSGRPRPPDERRATPARQRSSGRDELVPLALHVDVLVHDRVPAGDRAHPVIEGAAISDFTDLRQLVAIWVGDRRHGLLALEPVAP